jgi:uncharacterized membrane protein (DUF485 family)
MWGASFLFTEWLNQDIRNYMEMSMRRYPLFPLCMVTALAGTMMVAQFSSLLVRYFGWAKKPLIFLGEHSLDMLCVHTMDFLWVKLCSKVSSSGAVQAMLLLAMDLVVFTIYVFVKKQIKERKK